MGFSHLQENKLRSHCEPVVRIVHFPIVSMVLSQMSVLNKINLYLSERVVNLVRSPSLSQTPGCAALTSAELNYILNYDYILNKSDL